MVEEGKVADIFARPAAAYTRELLAAVPRIGTGARRQASRPTAQIQATEVATVSDLHVRFDINGGIG